MAKDTKKRPSDANQLAKLVVDQLTGEDETIEESPKKNPAAVALGRLGGLKGGPARAKKLSKKQLSESRLEVQRYLVPQLVELSRSEVILLSEHLPALAAIGIELEVFGEATIAVQGLPALMRRPDPAHFFLQHLDPWSL